jgi:DNA-directed RNA polymerase specialized sigma24 family protein
MLISEKIAPHLPYLRRFARALCGNQASGDAYVAAVIEALIANPSSLTEHRDSRAALYRMFLQVWNSVDLNTAPLQVWTSADPNVANGVERGAEAGAVRCLGGITPRPRQTFLLTSMEGFSLDDGAFILGTTFEEVTQLLDQAGREIAGQLATDVLVIEDEPFTAMDLVTLVESLGHRVIGRARTHSEAVRIVQRKPPGLVLADVQLADGSSGLDAVNDILRSMTIPVIFITGYPELLLTGERPEPAFLLTKPFSRNEVKAVISQALFFDVRATQRKAS